MTNIEYLLKQAGAEMDAIKIGLHESKVLLNLARYNDPPAPRFHVPRYWSRYHLYHVPRQIGRVGTPSSSSAESSDDENESGGDNPSAAVEEP